MDTLHSQNMIVFRKSTESVGGHDGVSVQSGRISNEYITFDERATPVISLALVRI